MPAMNLSPSDTMQALRNLVNGNSGGQANVANLLQALAGGSFAMNARTECVRGNVEVVKALVEKDFDLLTEGPNVLQAAVAYGRHEIVMLMLSKGLKISDVPESIKPSPDESPFKTSSNFIKSPYILQAATTGSVETIQVLLRHGASLEDRGYIGLTNKRKNGIIATPLAAAAFHGHLAAVEFLLQRGADKEATCKEEVNKTATTSSSSSASTDKREVHGSTPLLLALYKGQDNLDVVRTLINRGANIHAVDCNGNTGLHICALFGWKELASYLIHAGVDVLSTNKKGVTAERFAREKQHGELEKLLKEKGEEFTRLAEERLLVALDSDMKKLQKEREKRKQKKDRKKQREARDEPSGSPMTSGSSQVTTPSRSPVTVPAEADRSPQQATQVTVELKPIQLIEKQVGAESIVDSTPTEQLPAATMSATVESPSESPLVSSVELSTGSPSRQDVKRTVKERKPKDQRPESATQAESTQEPTPKIKKPRAKRPEPAGATASLESVVESSTSNQSNVAGTTKVRRNSSVRKGREDTGSQVIWQPKAEKEPAAAVESSRAIEIKPEPTTNKVIETRRIKSDQLSNHNNSNNRKQSAEPTVSSVADAETVAADGNVETKPKSNRRQRSKNEQRTALDVTPSSLSSVAPSAASAIEVESAMAVENQRLKAENSQLSLRLKELEALQETLQKDWTRRTQVLEKELETERVQNGIAKAAAEKESHRLRLSTEQATKVSGELTARLDKQTRIVEEMRTKCQNLEAESNQRIRTIQNQHNAAIQQLQNKMLDSESRFQVELKRREALEKDVTELQRKLQHAEQEVELNDKQIRNSIQFKELKAMCNEELRQRGLLLDELTRELQVWKGENLESLQRDQLNQHKRTLEASLTRVKAALKSTQ